MKIALPLNSDLLREPTSPQWLVDQFDRFQEQLIRDGTDSEKALGLALVDAAVRRHLASNFGESVAMTCDIDLIDDRTGSGIEIEIPVDAPELLTLMHGSTTSH